MCKVLHTISCQEVLFFETDYEVHTLRKASEYTTDFFCAAEITLVSVKTNSLI